MSLSSAVENSDFKIASGPEGDAWVSGAASDGGPAGVGVWHVSADGQTLISSAAVYGAFDIYAGGVAVDASSRAWVSAAKVLSEAPLTAEFALWRFESDGSLSAGFPVTQRRENGVLDGGLSIAVDAAGDVWSAGVSSNPAAAAYDLALWRFDPDGGLRQGFPVYRASAFASLDEIDSGIVIAAGEKVWVASSQLFPGCADKQLALFRFDANGAVELQRYWHNAAENESSGETIALASDGSPWMLGRSSNTTAVWSFDRFGALEPGYPRTDAGLGSGGIALDAGDGPWVVYGSTPGAFVGAQSVAGAEGLPSCAQLSSGTIDGSVIVEGGSPEGSSVTIVASPDGFQMQMFAATFVSTGGASVPFTIELETAGDYAIGAFVGDNPDVIDVSTPIGFYRGFTPVSLAPGGSASGVDFTIALDTVAPVVAVAYPVAGSTVSALPVVEGSGYDANGVGDVELAVQDTDADLWYDPNASGWFTSASPLYRSVNAEVIGPSNSVEWSVAISSVDNGNFGRLDERLVQGHHYRVLAVSGDFVGRVSEPGETTFTWNGPTGNVGPQQPSALNGQALGTSSIAWSWNASQGATAYFLASSSDTAPFASVTTTSYISEGLVPAETRMLCVAGVNLLIAGEYSCSTAESLPAVPGAVAAAEVFETSVTWSWTSGGNGPDASYELSLSTDGFAAHVSTPLPVGFYHRATSYTAEGLAPGTVYTARVRAYNLGLTLSDFSPSGSTRTSSGALQPPFNVTALFGRAEAKVSLSWTAPEPVPASYRVYRGTETGSLTLLGGTTDTAFADFPSASAFYFYAVSALGELGGESPLSGVQSVRFDVTPPSVSFVQPADGETLSRPYTVIVNASDDFTSASVRFYVDGIARATTTVSHQFFWDVRAETDGPHALAAIATDDDSNQTSISRSVVVAYSTPVPPTVIVPSDNFSTLATTFTVQGFAPLLTGVSVYADAVVLGTSAVDAIGQWGLPEASFPGRGDFLLTAVAFEARGESSASAPLRVASFAEPPAAPGTVSAAVDRQTGLVELTWGASAGATPALDYRVERATAADGEYLVLASTPTTAYHDFPGVAGAYHYRVRAAHGTGLLSAFVATSATYDVTPPSAITDLRVAAYRPQAGELDLAWTAASDDFSGVARQLLVRSLSGRFDGDASTVTLAAAAPGSTSTYTVLVATGAESFRVFTEDAADNRSAASNTAVHDTVAPEIVSVSLPDGDVVSRPRYVSVTANDNIGATRLVFILNGSTEADVAQSSYSFFWDIRDWTDGEVEFVVDAYDAAGNKTSLLLNETISYAPPAAPTIYSPSNGFGIQVATITISGASDPGVGIDLLVNGLDVATTSAESGYWTFDSLRLPSEGDIRLTAIAFESRGFSSPSTAVNGVYSATSPEPPEFVNGESASGGRSQLSWQAPTGGKRPTYYRVYRSTDDASLVAGDPPPAGLRVATNVAALAYTETPPADDLYFYSLTSVDGAGKESVQSAVVYVLADRVPPSASVVFLSTPPFGPGDYPASLTLSEPLSSSPLFTFTPPDGQPQALPATPLTAALWRTTVTITSDMNPGVGTLAFQGTDLAGNVGHDVSSGTIALDTRGPVGIVMLSRPSPVSTGTVTVTLTLDEPSVSTPALVFTAQEGAPIPLTLSQAGAGDNRTWEGGLTISALTGEGQASMSGYSASDALGNLGVTLLGSTTFLIDTVAPGPPRVVRANAAPAGVIFLSWSAPLGEQPRFYRVVRDGVTLSTQVPASPEDGSGAYTDTPSEGLHNYAASSIDAAGNESESVDPQVTSKATPPSPPASVNAVIGQFGQIQVSWISGSPDSTAYRLYRATEPITTLAGLTPRAVVSPFPDSPTVNGTYHYVVTALDFATNESTTSAESSVVWDQSAPTIVIAGFTDKGYAKTDVTPTFAAFDPALDTTSVQGTLDGQPFASGAVVSSEGVHVLGVTAATLGGHAAFSSATFTLDKTPPAIVFDGIAPGAQLVSTVPVSASVTITDAHPGAATVFLTNALLGVTVPYANGDPIGRNGDYALTASATDLAGNSSTSTLSFRLQIGPIAPKSFSVLIQGSARLSWTAPEPGLAGYRVYRDGARISASLFTGTFFEDTGFDGGAHVYEVSAVDAAGVEGPRQSAPVPAATLGLRDITLTRGFFDALTVTLANGATDSTYVVSNDISLTLRDAAGAVAAAAEADGLVANPGSTGTAAGVFAVPATLSMNALVQVSATLQDSSTSYSVTFAGEFPVQSRAPAEPLLEVFPGTLVLGTPSPVQVRLYNRGSAPMDVVTAQIANSTISAVDNVTVKLLTSEGTLLASGGIAQYQHGAQSAFVGGKQVYFVTVPAGGSFLFDPVRVVVPNTAAGSLNVAAYVSTPSMNVPFGVNALPGTRGFSSSQAQATVSQVPYTVTVSPDQPVFDQGTVVGVSGQALDVADGTPVPNSPVSVHVVANGYDRHVDAVTDSSGSYHALFFPLPTEAGVYSMYASHPDVVTHAVTSSFTIVGFSYEYDSFTATLAQNSSLPFSFKLTNTGATPITGLQISTISLITGEGLVLALDTTTLPASLAAGAATTLNLTVAAAPTASSGTFKFELAESHGFTRSIPVTVTVFPAEVVAKLTPSQFSIGMLGGESRTVSITVQNIGFDTWRGVTVTAPALEWVTVQGSGLLGDIAPRGVAVFTLSINPPLSLSNGTYAETPLLQLTSLNTPPVGLPAAVAITSSRKGNAAFSVINADKPRTGTLGVPIPSAVATMVSLDVEALSFKATADANGLATFTQIPAGKYSWHVDVTGFQTKSGTLTIEPGLTQSLEVPLPTSVVSYEWKVTPTRIQDKYDVVLDLAFKTDVPAPVVVMEPAILDLQMTGGQSTLTQFTVTNKGLVAALDVKVGFSGDDAIIVEMPINNIPRLEPGQTVTIPAKITLVHASCHGAGASIFAHFLCALGIDMPSSFPGSRITAGDGCGGGTIASGGGGGGGGAGGPVSGGYIDFVGFTGSNGVTCATTPSGEPQPSCGERCNTPSNPPPHPQPVPPHPVPPLPPPAPPSPKPPFCPLAPAPPFGSPAASPALDATPHFNSDQPEDGPLGFGWFSAMHQSIQLLGSGSLMSVDESGNQLIYTPLNNPPDGYTAFYAQPINTRTSLQGLDVSNGSPNTVVQNYPDGSTIRYGRFGTNNYLPAVLTDRNGNVVTYERDPAGRLLVARDVHNRTITYTYNPAGKISGMADSAGRTMSFIYDTAGNRISDTDVNGDVTQYQYNAFHRPTEITYPNNGKKFITYGTDGRVATVSENGDNYKETYGYDDSNRKTTITDALNHVTTYDWIENSGMRRTTKVQDSLNGEESFAYDADLRVTSYIDSKGQSTAFTYDSNGNQVAMANPLNQVTQAIYNSRYNTVASITDPKGNKASFFYDAKGNLIQIKDAASNFTTVSYDGKGHPTSIRDPLGNTVSLVYNNNGAVTRVIDPLNRSIDLTRDSLSRITEFVNPEGKRTSLQHDAAGNVTQVKNALNGIVAFNFEPGRTSRNLHSLTDENSHATVFGYDIVGRLTSVTNALNQAGLLDYDKNGNLTTFTEANGNVLTFVYDALNRAISKSFSQGSVQYEYDSTDNVTKISHSNGSVLAMTYDGLDRVTQELETLPGGFQASINYTYDGNGNVTTMATPWGSFSYSFDSLNLLTRVINPQGKIISFQYDAVGRRTATEYPNGIRASFIYNNASELTQVIHRKTADNTAVAFANYTYNSAGAVTNMQDMDGTHTYAYDALYQLTNAIHPALSNITNKNETFTYDPAGNRTSDSTSPTYTHDAANRVTENNDFTFTYDANGNLATKTAKASNLTTSYVFDNEGQLAQINRPDGNVLSFKYDGLGRRVERRFGSTNPTITRYIYSGRDIVAILDGNNNLVSLFTNGPGRDEPLYVYQPAGGEYSLHADGLGSILAHADATGTLVERIVYDSFGRGVFADVRGQNIQISSQSFTGSPYSFTGREWEYEAGMYFYRTRYYSPDIGRFVSQDPISFAGGDTNLYRYVANSPINARDPLGTAAFGGAVGGAVGRAIGAPVGAGIGSAIGGAAGAIIGGGVGVGGGTLALPGGGTIAGGAVGVVTGEMIGSVIGAIAGAIEGQRRMGEAGARIGSDIEDYISQASEHTKNKSRVRWDKHTKKRPGDPEKGDTRRDPHGKRPKGWKGPWPRKPAPCEGQGQ